MYDTGYDSYRQTEITVKAANASPPQLVIMLMDGLMDELDRAEGHMQARNYARKGEAIKKSMRILSGLSVALDLEQGGNLATHLKQLYQFCGKRLMKASIRNDAAELQQVRKILHEIRTGWIGFAKRHAAG
nr:flagellar export chaperone FliS [uncultured Tolumonas sp.]